MGTKTLSQLPIATLAEAENIFHVRQGLADKQMSLPVLSRFVIRDSVYGYQELEITTNTVISEIQRIHTVLKFNSSSAVSCELPFSGDIEAGATVWAYNIGTGTATLTYQSGVSTALPTGERARLVWNGAAWILDSSTRYAEASEWFRINGGPRIKKGATVDTLAVRNSTDTDYGVLEVKGLTLHETITADAGEFNTLAVSGAAEFNAPTGAPFSVASSEKVVNLNADKLDGYHANTGTAAGTVPVRDANGKVPGSITGDADTLDGYHANTGAVAGTIPVRDANGKVPGSITGDADTLDGYHANTGTTASTIPVRNASGIIPGSISGNAATATRIGARTTADQSGWEYATQCPDNYGITWLACSGKWWSYNNQDAPEPSIFTYFEITAVNAKEFLIVAYTGNNTVYYGITSWGEPNRIWGGWNRIGNSKRGLKNTLYNVNWIIDLSPNKEFTIHQPVMASLSSNVIRAYTSNSMVTQFIVNDGVFGAALAPGRYINFGSTALSLRIGYAPSQTQSDIITLY